MIYHKKEKSMRKKQLLLIIATILCALILSSSMSFAAGQQVKIPYVISNDAGWWTGIAITNNSGDPITDMKLYFTTNTGASNSLMAPQPKTLIPDPKIPDPIIPRIIFYNTTLDDISGNAQLSNTIDRFYTGEGSKTLPSGTGSVVFSHPGDEEFAVTVYIGYGTGFAFQCFISSPVGP